MFNESTPRPLLGLGATARPSYCPALNTSVDPCEMKYSVDIPIVGRTEVGVPVSQMVDDAIASAVKRLPAYLPTVMAQMQPYIAALEEDVVKTIEYEADYLADELLQTKVDPRVTTVVADVTAQAQALKNEILVTLAAIGASMLIGVGVSAWWLNREAQLRRSGR
jgi:hypothetical protein